MLMKERDAVLERFAESGGPSVLVVSTKAGGVGLSLTRASRYVFRGSSRVFNSISFDLMHLT